MSLLPELEERRETGELFEMIHHPLLIAAPYWESENEHYNDMFKRKRESLEVAQNNEDWTTAVYLHERPYRLEALITYWYNMDEQTRSELLGSVWVDCEAPHVNLSEWRSLFRQCDMDYAMDEIERQTLLELPDIVTVYRGQKLDLPVGIAWTLSEETALWFANRWDKTDGHVLKRTINKKDIHAYFNGRNEQEIILL